MYYRDTSGSLQVDRTTHYYPFGLEFGGELSTSGSITPNYRYSSQGQENQRETKWSSYKWRNYDAAMGRFFNVDPLAEDYNTWSTYAFSGNRVVDARELEGLEPKKVNGSSLPADPMEFAEFIGGGINSVRAAVANSVGRTINVLTNDAVRNKYEVEGNGALTLMTGVPRESFKEKVVNGSLDLATIGLAAFGGVEGALTAQGGKAPALKAIEEVKAAAKIPSIASQRQGAVRKAWKEEQNMVKNGKDGTREWTKAELKELKETGKVKGMKGHHINNVKHHPDKAGDPNNIEFVTQKEHLDRHNGNFRNETTG
ncbi:RHS repeat-associated core domain-containing protein, partial [Chryseobacterium rhizosphaerae]